MYHDPSIGSSGWRNKHAQHARGVIDAHKTGFCHKPGETLAAYPRCFGENFEFEQAHNSVWIVYDTWQRSTRSATPALLSILKAQTNQLLSELGETGNFLEHTNFLIGSNVGAEAFSMEVLAEHLNMTSRTLHRKMGARHQFQEVAPGIHHGGGS